MSRYVSNDELAAVNPAVLGAMLMKVGWREMLGKPGLLRILESPDSDTDISIPLNPGFRDYRTRLNQALISAEQALGDRARSFMLQLLVGPMDELLFKEEAPTIYGSIAWRLGEQLYDTAREACRAAAKSAEHHLPHFGSKGSGAAGRFMDRIRMGQTETGSYIVTALVPLHESTEAQPLIGFEDIPKIDGGFFRDVTVNLMQAAAAAVNAADEYNRTESFEPFADAVDYGVSADLVDALSKLSGRGQEAEITAQWSPLVAEPVDAPRSVEVKPDHLSAFAEAVTRFKGATPVTTVTVRGMVTGLDRVQFGQSGTSTLNVLSGISAKRLRVRLRRDQYDAAIVAHQVGDILQVTGEQSRVGNLFWLYNIRDIQIIPGQQRLFGDQE